MDGGCKEAATMVIDLEYYGSSELPAELFTHKDITRLSLRAHSLKVLNSDIGQLTNLIMLDLCSFDKKTKHWHSFLDRVPDSICQLRNLVQLDLSYNGLLAFPASCHRLKSLRCLNLACNRLTDLPLTLFRLENLQMLSLRDNKLSFIHPDVCRLKALQYFDVAKNMMEEVPNSIGQCKMLSTLLLDSLCITELPQEINDLTSLSLLELSFNQRLQSLPEGLHKLPHLTGVHITGCHPQLLKSNVLLRLHKVLVRNRASTLAQRLRNDLEPMQFNYDLVLKRPVEDLTCEYRMEVQPQ